MDVIVYGNPVDGLNIIGPFEDCEKANDYADDFLRGEDWWITTMEAPDLDAQNAR